MGFKNILLIATALPALIQGLGIDFSSLAPSVPPLQSNTFNETTGYPNDGNTFYINKKKKILDYKTISLKYLEDEYPGLTFEVNSVVESEVFYTATVNLVQTKDGKKINNSFVTLNVDKRKGVIIDANHNIWEDANFNEDGLNDQERKEDIIASLKGISKAFSLNEGEGSWDSIEIFKLDKEQYSVNNVPFSDTVVARKIYTVQDGEGIMVWEFTFLYEGVYNTISYDYINKKPINGFESRSNLRYKVYPFSKFTEHELVDVVDPVNEYIGLSPFGWHKLSNDITTRVTLGNNVIAQDYSTKYTFNGGKDMVFDGTNCNNTKDCNNKYNRDVTLSTMFYYGNMLHDIFYNLGFDEKSGNYQQYNFGKGGMENDAIIMNYYDEDCSTDEKRQNNPLCEVNCPSTSATRDGIPAILRFPVLDMEQGRVGTGISSHIVIHEFTHAVTQRLVGGPNYDCFVLGDNVDGASLGEGYSDFFSEALQFDKNSGRDRNSEFLLDHVWNRSNIVSSLQEGKYSDLKHIRDSEDSIYYGGSIWRLMLHDVFWNIVDNYPSSDDYFKVYNSNEVIPSNILLLRIIIKGLSIQGCNPDFIRARNGIITAMERNPYTSTNYKFQCLVWKGFADRGLGYNALKPLHFRGKYTYIDNFDLPDFCKNEKF